MLLIILVVLLIGFFIYHTVEEDVSEGILASLAFTTVSSIVIIIASLVQAGVGPTTTTPIPVTSVTYYASTDTYQVDVGTESIEVRPDDAAPAEDTTLIRHSRSDNFVLPWDMPPIAEWETLQYNPDELDIRP